MYFVPLKISPISPSSEGAPESGPMVIFFRSTDATRSLSRWPAEDAKPNSTFFSGSAAAVASARTLLPTKMMFFALLARRVSMIVSSWV